MNTVPLSVARRLKELGLPQENFPQLIRWDWQGEKAFTDLFFLNYDGYTGDRKWYAAPSPLEALEFLEEMCGWRFGRTRTQAGDVIWTALNPHGPRDCDADTASALVEAIVGVIGKEERE